MNLFDLLPRRHRPAALVTPSGRRIPYTSADTVAYWLRHEDAGYAIQGLAIADGHLTVRDGLPGWACVECDWRGLDPTHNATAAAELLERHGILAPVAVQWFTAAAQHGTEGPLADVVDLANHLTAGGAR